MVRPPFSSSPFRQIFYQMSAVPGSQPSSMLHHQLCRLRPRCYAMISLPGSISALPFGSRLNRRRSTGFSLYRQTSSSSSSTVSGVAYSTEGRVGHLSLSLRLHSLGVKQSVMKEGISRTCWVLKPGTWLLRGTASGLCVSFASAQPVSADAAMAGDGGGDGSAISSSHGKKVFTDYTVTGDWFILFLGSLTSAWILRSVPPEADAHHTLPGIPGDGRCLFRSVAHGACLRSGKPVPDEGLQRELADELRSKVYFQGLISPETELINCFFYIFMHTRYLIINRLCQMQIADEFIKRREETEWWVIS